MTDRSPSTSRRLVGTAVAIIVGIAVFAVLARLAGAPPLAVVAGAVVVAVVGVATAITTPRRRARRRG